MSAHAGGGTVIEHSIHDIDVLRWMLGDPVEVVGAHRVAVRVPGIEDTAAATFSYADGSVAQLTSVWHQVLTRESSRRLEVFCEKAMLWTDDDYLGPLHVQTDDGEQRRSTVEPPEWSSRFTLPEVYAKALAQYAEPSKAFLDALGSGRPGRRSGGRPGTRGRPTPSPRTGWSTSSTARPRTAGRRNHAGSASSIALRAGDRAVGQPGTGALLAPAGCARIAAMPLSDEEQKILREIEAQLNATDPALGEQVSRTTLYRHSARMIRWAALGLLGGLVLLVFTFASHVWVGAIGFAVMLGCSLVIERHVRKLGRAGLETLTGGLRGPGRAAGHVRRTRPPVARSLPPRRFLTARAVGFTARAGRAACRAAPSRSCGTGRARDSSSPAASDGGYGVSRSRRVAGRALDARRGPAVGARAGRARRGARRRPRPVEPAARSPTAATCGRATTTARSSTRSRSGQLALFVAVDQVAAEVDADVRAFSRERAAFVDGLTARG